jgi:hypothetical protein
MKKIFKTLLCLTLFGLLLTSCSKDSDNNDTPVAPAGKFIAKIDGVSFEADGGAQIYNDVIIVAGINGTKSVSVIVTKGVTGTYDVKGTPGGVTPDAEVNYSPDGQTVFTSTLDISEKAGTVTITEIDKVNKTVSGTFSSAVISGNTATYAQITSGSFTKIPYSTAPLNTMTAKIDGTPFAATVVVAPRAMGMLVMNGQTLNGAQIITLSVSETVAPGTYVLGELGSEAYATYTANSTTFVSNAGTITITSHNTTTKRIVGTFSFPADPFIPGGDGHTVMEGAFAITYN